MEFSWKIRNLIERLFITMHRIPVDISRIEASKLSFEQGEVLDGQDAVVTQTQSKVYEGVCYDAKVRAERDDGVRGKPSKSIVIRTSAFLARDARSVHTAWCTRCHLPRMAYEMPSSTAFPGKPTIPSPCHASCRACPYL